MIKNSFIFLPRTGPIKERSLWEQEITGWEEFLAAENIRGISKKTKAAYDRIIISASLALREEDSVFFQERLPSTETWRLYDYFREDAIFLDIEASSATSKDSYLTVIGLYDGQNTKVMIRNFNLDIPALKNELAKYKLIITFNGSSFDIPFLKKKYPGVLPDVPHIDLRHLCARLGLKGGLKQIEKELNISRDNKIIERLYGGDPLKLYRMFLGSGDRYYLKLLVEYNEEDVINLKKIADYTITHVKDEVFSD